MQISMGEPRKDFGSASDGVAEAVFESAIFLLYSTRKVARLGYLLIIDGRV